MNERYGKQYIAYWYQLGRSTVENAALVKEQFLSRSSCGNGIVLNGAKIAAWFDDRGICIARGTTARNGISQTISWEQAAQRIGQLLDTGVYAPQDMLVGLDAFYRSEIAEKLIFLEQEMRPSPFREEDFYGGFPDTKARITSLLAQPEVRADYIGKLQSFLAEYELDRSLLRYRPMYPIYRLISDIQDLGLEHRVYRAVEPFPPLPEGFITDDEIDACVVRRLGFAADHFFPTLREFTAQSTSEAKAAFLRFHAGTGGSSHAVSGAFRSWENHDSKGLKLDKGDAQVKLTWPKVAARLSKLIGTGEIFRDDEERNAYAEWVEANGAAAVRQVPDNAGMDDPDEEDGDDVLVEDTPTESDASSSQQVKAFTDRQPGWEVWSEPATAENAPENSDEPSDDPAAYFNNLPEPQPWGQNYRITDDHLGEGGAKARYGRNIAAIRLVKQLVEEDRQATTEEQNVLAQYVGWGGLPQVFDADNASWEKEYQELSALLDPEEYAMARGSTLNAHYTSPTVIRAIYEAVANMGFESGRILEPSCGVGNFFGLLPESMANSRLNGVELDPITGFIARKLYPSANIHIQGFEETGFKDESFDLIIGNVPFGSYKVNDKRYNKLNFLIHDYFIAKSLDVARAGGIIAVITSNGTLDKQSPEVRRYIAQRAELLGAIRLPNTAFKRSAGTEVTSDILFLQKRDRPIVTDPDWLRLGTTADGVPVNQYFIDHPEMVLGTMAWVSGAYGNETACVPIPGVDLADQLRDAIRYIGGTYTPALEKAAKAEVETQLPADPRVRNYSFTIVDGQAYFRENDVMNHKPFGPVELERVMGMVALRDQVRELMERQLNNASDAEITENQRVLGTMYDVFTAKYGLIDSRANAAVFDQDDGYYLLCSLEILDDDRKNLLRKSDMFTKRTIRRHQVVTSVGTASEALAVSIGEKGRVDIPYMCQLCSMEPDALTVEQQGVIFRDITSFWDSKADKYFEPGAPKPARDTYILINRPKLIAALNEQPTEHWVTADEYLSGDVRHKLAMAEKLNTVTGLYADNVQALREVQPKDLEPDEIDVRLGATWVPPEYIHKFLYDLLKIPGYLFHKIKVVYLEHSGDWHIENKTILRDNVQVNEVYGTGRASAFHIMEDTLNLRDVRVYDYFEDSDGKKKQVLNQDETLLAQQKQTQIKEAFRDWIWQDADRRDKLVRLYNDRFNCIRPREYDGRHIQFVGMNPEITLDPHQRNAVARALYGGNTLLAHVVGAGKSFTMIAIGMESRRLGLNTKNLHSVPNHLIGQFAAEHLRLYPNANILVATERDFETGNRKRFCARIAAGDYDAIIMGHTQYERIPVSAKVEKEFLQQEIDDILDGIDEVRRNHGERYTIKQLEKSRKALTARLKALNDTPRDDVVTFEQLGADKQFIDEADLFKNLALYTKMRNVAGIGQSESKRASDLFMKCRYLDKLTGSRGNVFATGTPISNSMTEAYTMQRYMQYEKLLQRGLQHFDSWASTFGESVTAIELAPEGTGYRLKTRFARFYNLPELMSMFREFADIQTADMLNLPVPKLKTGKIINIPLKPSLFQKEMVAGLGQRAEQVRNRKVQPYEDNMLKITNDGRLLALDQRLLNPALPDDPGSKPNACVENVLQIYREGMEKKLTQLVFCDLSTPNGKPIETVLVDGVYVPVETTFTSVYQDIKEKLIARDIPANEIAFIHYAKTQKQREELFAKVRRGAVRVLIGSTQKMGAGTNVQRLLVALHHLDVPWRPRDLQQRDGRALRQGNTNEEVAIYRYVTEGTFDAYSYQLVEQKQRYIAQVMTSKSPMRRMEDIDDTALSYAEVKALAAGSPLIKERMDLDVEIAKLKMLKSAHFSQRYRLEDRLRHTFPMEILKLQERIRGLQEDIARRDAGTPAGYAGNRDLFMMEVMNQTYSKREDAGKALLLSLQLVNPEAREALRVGHHRGFELWASFDAFSKTYTLEMKGSLAHRISLDSAAAGNVTRIDNALERLENTLQHSRDELVALEQQMNSAQEEVGKPFPQEQELMEKLARLTELDGLLRMDEKVQEIIEDDGDSEPQEEQAKSRQKEPER